MATGKAIIYKGIPYFSDVNVPTRVSQLANDAGYVTTDEKVKQTPNTTSMDSHPILFSASDSSGEVVGGAYKNSNFYYRPDANHLIFKNGGGIEISSGTTGVSVLSQYIRLTDLDDDHSIMNITTNDIELENVTSQGTTYSNTWDGTHHSLKTSIRSLVSKSGDTISGDYVNTADFSEGGVTGKRVTTYGPWGIDVEEYVGTSLWSRLSLRDSDILLTKTWDGTNTSLKQSLSNKLNKRWTLFADYPSADSIPIALPNEFDELLISVSFNVSNHGWCSHDFYIPKDILSSTQVRHLSGWYYSTSDCGSFMVYLNNQTITQMVGTRAGAMITTYAKCYYR